MKVVRFLAFSSTTKSDSVGMAATVTGEVAAVVIVTADTGCEPNRTLPTPNVCALGVFNVGAAPRTGGSPGGIGGGGAFTLAEGVVGPLCTACPSSANPRVRDIAGAVVRVALAKSVREIFNSGSSAGEELHPNTVHPPFSS